MKRQAIVAQGTVEVGRLKIRASPCSEGFRSPSLPSAVCAGVRRSRPCHDGVLQAFDFGPTAMQPTPGASDDFYDRDGAPIRPCR